jgi:hypothetical protein
MSGLRVGEDLDGGKERGRQRLLALRHVRRGLERRAPCGRASTGECVAVVPDRLSRELHELIEALDRRVPRVEQAGAEDIARDAAALRAKALQRLRELEALNEKR